MAGDAANGVDEIPVPTGGVVWSRCEDETGRDAGDDETGGVALDEGLRLLHTATSAARAGLLPLDSETVARLLVALTHPQVRDAACVTPTAGAADPVELMWLGIACSAPPGLGAEPLAVLAYQRWQRGALGAARRAAEAALNVDGDHRLAGLVMAAAVGGVSAPA